ncbi:MAG: hypothetical protein ACOY5F_17180 [Pseudomonadota bacterium]
MVPGGVTETIWHFAGYFYHIDDVMKNRIVYEHGGLSIRPDDYAAQLKAYLSRNDLDEFDTDRLRPEPPLASEELSAALLGRYPMREVPAIEETDFDADRIGRIPVPRVPLPPIDLPPDPGTALHITVNYAVSTGQQLLQIDQFNHMLDGDRFGVLPDIAVETFHDFDIEAALEQMIGESKAEVPDDLAVAPSGTTAVLEFVVARDVAMAEAAGPDPHSVAPGYYVNGVLTERPAEPAGPREPVPEPDHTLKGQWAILGENEASNAALIADLKEGSNTMIVLGDFYKTNVIAQFNSYIDNDKVDISSVSVGNLVAGANVTDNIADFEQLDGPFAGFPSFYAGLTWNVEVVDGDFYDVNVVVQQNVLRDNDITVQNTSVTHFEVRTGDNDQINVAQVFDGEVKYDLIVIGGDYHGANWIFQHNVILDSDILKIGATGDAAAVAGQSASAGENELLNNARIISYGDNNFAEPTEDMQSVVDALVARDDTLDTSYGWFVPGNGTGVLNVLFVTGNYYDINAIWQFNVISDVDTAMQFLDRKPPAAIAGDGSLTQSVSSGSNLATNEAIIVDAGATSSFVMGDVYQDTILIQGNLTGENNDKITVGDPSALIPEIVAFTGEDCPVEEVTDIRAPVVADDTLASILT